MQSKIGHFVIIVLVINFIVAKVRIFSELSKKNLQVIDTEDAAVADFSTFAGGEQLHVAPTTIKIVAERDTILQMENGAVRLPHVDVDRVAAVEHGTSRAYVD